MNYWEGMHFRFLLSLSAVVLKGCIGNPEKRKEKLTGSTLG